MELGYIVHSSSQYNYMKWQATMIYVVSRGHADTINPETYRYSKDQCMGGGGVLVK